MKQWIAGAALALATMTGTAYAYGHSSYPERPIMMMVSYGAGGATDFQARIVTMTAGNEDALGMPIAIVNRPGAGGVGAVKQVAGAKPDGHTLLYIGAGVAISQALFKPQPYDMLESFAPVCTVSSNDVLLLVRKDSRFTKLDDFIREAREKKGALMVGVSLLGTTQHLCAELFKLRTGTDIQHVPYKGGSLAVADVAAGHVPFYFGNMSAALPQARAGRVRALAVTSPQRSPAAPEVPTLAEAGVTGCEISEWNALLAPAGTPKEVVDRLNAELKKALDNPEVKQRFEAQGFAAAWNTPAAYAGFLQAEVDKWGKVVKASGAKID